MKKIGVILDSCGITSLTESAQAQQVNVTIAKVKYAKDLYGNIDIPESILAACFGGVPTVNAPTVEEKKIVEKKKSWLSLYEDKETE